MASKYLQSIKDRPALFQTLLIVLVALVPYLHTFDVPFYLDDENNIINNPVIHDLGRFLSDGFRFNPRRFVGYLTLALNFHFGGLNVAGYHAVNLVIHVLTALLVYTLVRLLFRTPMLRGSALFERAPLVALVTALLFAVHPIQTQAITYIVQRFAALATLFYLLSIVLYLRGRLSLVRPERVGREAEQDGPDSGAGEGSGGRTSLPFAWSCFIGSLAAGILALMTKEPAATLPLVLLLCELVLFRHGRRGKFLLLIPFAVAAVMAVLILPGRSGPLGQIAPGLLALLRESPQHSRIDYLLTECRVVVTYLRLLVLPVGQNIDYNYRIYHTFFTPPVFFSFLLLTGLLALAVVLSGFKLQIFGFKKNEPPVTRHASRFSDPALRLAGFGIFWFFLTLSVTSSIIPIADVIFEHRLYLPSVGFFLAVAVLVFVFGRGVSLRWLLSPLLMVVVVLGGLTFARNQLWRDPVAMWQDVVRKSPAKERAWCNLGYVLLERGRLDEAIGHLLTARQLNPDFAKTYLNLGVAYGQLGRSDLALANLERAVELEPQLWLAHYNLGILYARQGQLDRAIEHLQEALRFNPEDAQSRVQLELFLRMRGG